MNLIQENPDLERAVTKLEETMEFTAEIDDKLATFMETTDEYPEALEKVKGLLDELGHRIDAKGIQFAVARKLDPTGELGFEEVI